MATVREHYEEVLSHYYSRMFGEFEAKVAEQQGLLERLGITARQGGDLAVDLGCGSGFQSIALARLGFRVLAIDFSHRLLAELNERARGLPVAALAGDIRDVAALAPTGVELVVCMGDTLSHLECEGDLERVLASVAARLAVGGRFVLTFRDLSGQLHDLDRFIPAPQFR
jgi:SAM-dependent methyltransferase